MLASTLMTGGMVRAMTQEYLDLLKNSVILSALGDEQLADLSRHVEVRRFALDQVIMREGDPGDGAYVVSSGAVAITTQRQGGQSAAALAMLGRGQVFGEMALLDQQPRSATATAAAETTCLFLPTPVFNDLLQRNPTIALALLPVLSQRLRDADRWIQSLM